MGEVLDMSVGFSDFACIGTHLDSETPLAVVHAATEDDADKVSASLLKACTTSSVAAGKSPVIAEILTGNS